MQQRILGVDPGAVSGALGFIPHEGEPHVDDVPVVDKQVDGAALARTILRLDPDVIAIENVGSMPKQGVASTFKFGMGVGIIRGVVTALGIPYYLVAPQTWKKHFKLDSDKEKARAAAIRLYPNVAGLDRKKDAGRAEALLIARWYVETFP